MFQPTTRFSGIVSVRAEQDLDRVLVDLRKGFDDFRSRYDKKISDIEAWADALAVENTALRIGGSADAMAGKPHGGRLPDEPRREILAQMRGLPSARLMEIGSDPDGGYTVPREIDQTILPLLRASSPLRQWATVVVQTDGFGSWSKIITRSGVASGWVAETEDRPETDAPVLGMVEITPQELMAMPVLTNRILEDSSFDLEGFLSADVASEFALQESIAFVSGNGVKKPLGFLAKPTVTTADATRAFGTFQHVVSATTGTFDADDLINLQAALQRVFLAGAGVGWIMNTATEAKVRKLKDSTGQYIWRAGIEAGQPNSLLGYPVGIDETMPDVAANALPIAFGNWQRGYAIVERLGLKIIRDNITKKGWTKLYFYRRVGGGPLDSNAIKMLSIKP